jgi:5,10-methylenetetrahydromethanopterin reductase
VAVAASGPKVIEVAARTAEAIWFAVGADPERIRWASTTARSAANEAGKPEATYGAYIAVVVDDDRDRGRQLIAGTVASAARFAVMHGTINGPVEEGLGRDLTVLRTRYDMGQHFSQHSTQVGALSDRLHDTFSVVGPAGYCVDRLNEIVELGVEKLFIMTPSPGADRDLVRASRDRFEREVLPKVKAS